MNNKQMAELVSHITFSVVHRPIRSLSVEQRVSVALNAFSGCYEFGENYVISPELMELATGEIDLIMKKVDDVSAKNIWEIAKVSCNMQWAIEEGIKRVAQVECDKLYNFYEDHSLYGNYSENDKFPEEFGWFEELVNGRWAEMSEEIYQFFVEHEAIFKNKFF